MGRIKQHLRHLMAAAVAIRTVFALSVAYLAPFESLVFAQGGGSYPLTYSGRLTSQTGAPLTGTVNISATFWDAEISGTQRGEVFTFTSVVLTEGVFIIYFPFTGGQVNDIFGDGTAPVFVEIIAEGKTYPRQKFNYVPLAMRIPVDKKSLDFDDQSGLLRIKGTDTSATGSVLVSDGAGGVKWDNLNASNFVAKTVTNTDPTPNQVLTYQNGKWVAATPASTAPTGNYLTGLAGDITANGPGTGTATLAAVAIPGTAAKVTFDAKGRVLSGTTLNANDVTNALGFTPVSAVNITVGIGLNGGGITNSGTISLADTAVTAGTYTRANIVVDPQGRITNAENAPAIGDSDISATANIAQSKIAGLSTSLTAKQDFILAGNANQYYRGDKSWQTLNTAVVPESGTFLYFSDVRARASLTGTTPIAFSNTTGVISMVKSDGSTNGYLSSTDWTTFNGKQIALGFVPLNKAGDTMSGPLNLGSQSITGLGAPTAASDAATKSYVDNTAAGLVKKDGTTALTGPWAVGQDLTNVGNLALAQSKTLGLGAFDNATEATMTAGLNNSGVTSPDKGKTWFNKDSNQIKYWDGSSVKILGVAGSGLTSLNGLTTVTQNFATGTAGNAPDFVSNGSTHTLNIPMASASATVTAGLISNADYANFTGKISGVTGSSPINVTTTSGTATVSLATTGTAGSYAKVTTDAYGRVTAGTSLTAADVPPHSATLITSGTLGVANGGTGATSLAANNVLLGNGTNALQTIAAGTSGNVLTSDGTTWQSTALPASVTSVSGTLPITVTGTTTPVVAISQASGSGNGFLSSADWTTFNSKQAPGNYITTMGGDVTVSGYGSGSVTASLASVAIAGTSTKVTYDVKGRVTQGTSLIASDIPTLTSTQITTSLGYTPINRAGDSMSGALNMGASDVSNAGNIKMAASKTFALSTNSADPAGLLAADKGKTWFNSTTNQIKYWDGSAAVALGVSGAGLSSLNGQTGNTQTFATPGTTGTAPAWSSSSNAHTLSIPMASAASVTAGLLSNNDYNTFNNKVSNVAQGTGIAVTNSSGTATVSLATTGTSGSYTKVTTDAYGRVTAGTSLVAGDLPSHSAALITSGTLGVANGGTGATSLTLNNVILGNGTSPVQVVAPGTSGNVLTSNGTTWQSTTLPWGTPGAIGSTTPSSGAFTSVTSNAQAGYEAKPFGAAAGNTSEVRFDELAANGTNYVGFKAPDVLAANKVWVLPAADGTAGQVLKTDGAGNLGWVSTATGTVTSVTGTAPISVADGSSTPVISISQANATTGGFLSSSDWTAFTNKLSKSGDTMIGSLTLPLNGLAVGTSQLIMSNGNVGIGTTNPGAALQVAGTISQGVGGNMLTPIAGASSGWKGGYGYNLSWNGSNWLCKGDGSNNGCTGILSHMSLSPAVDMNFYIKPSTWYTDDVVSDATMESSYKRMQINTGGVNIFGNVGIGTTIPAASLDVNGQIKIQGGTPGAGKVLTSDANGLATWSTAAVGSITGVTAGAGLTGGGTTGSVTLSADVGTTANKLVQLDATAKLPAVDGSALTNLTPSSLSAAVPVAKGGTGLTSGTSGGIPYFNAASTMASSAALTSNGVVLGGGAGASPTATAAGAANSVLRVPSGGGAPSFGAVDLAQSSAVTGTLNLGNGGTGTSLLLTGGTGQYLKQTASGAAVSVGTIAAADLPTMVGDSGAGGTKGAVPAPASGDAAAGKYLKADGTWGVPASTTNWATPGALGTTTPSSAAFTTLTTNGNVGIGTTSLSRPLTLSYFNNAGSSGEIGLQLENRSTFNSTQLAFNASNLWAFVADGTSNTGRFYLTNYTTGRSPLIMNNLGKVGIGIDPSHELHIKSAYEDVYLNLQAAHENMKAHLMLSTGWFGNPYYKTAIVGAGFSSWSRSDLHFVLNSSENNNSYTVGTDTKMIIKNNGNVGIGTTSPTAPLDVRQDTAASWMMVTRAASVDNSSGFWQDSSKNTQIALRNGSGSLTTVIQSSGNSWLNGGNVGIGTTSPSNTLTVAGKIQSTSGGIVFPDGTTQTTSATSGTNNTILSGWPDVIGCAYTGGAIEYAMIGGADPTRPGTVYYVQGGSIIWYNSSTGAYSTHSGWTGWDCVTSAYTIAQLTSMGRTFNLAKGPAAQWLQNGTSGYYNVGNVGIGTTAPSAIMQVLTSSGYSYPASTGTSQSGAQFRMTSLPGATLDFGTEGSGKQWIQATNTSNLSFNYSLLLNPNGGNVGIGTTSPAGKLDVAGSICLNGANCITSWPSGGGNWVTSGSDSYLSSGKLGLGTSTPATDLSFGGTVSRTIQVDRNTGVGTTGGGLTVQAGGAISGGSNYNGGTLTLASGVATGTGTSKIEFKTSTGGSSGATDSSPSTKMTILGNGNVGIGTTAPGSPLTVNGTIQSTTGGIKFPDGTVQTTSATAGTNNTIYSGWPDVIVCNFTTPSRGYIAIPITNSTNGSGGGADYRVTGGDFAFSIQFNSAGTNSANYQATSWAAWSNNAVSDCNGQTISSLISAGKTYNIVKGPAGQWLQNGSNAYYNAGNVGIGTSNPTSSLTVNGTVESTSGGIKFPDGTTQNSGWIDPSVAGGRLTLTTGVPVTTADVTNATTIYYTPYKSDRIALYNGTNWRIYSFNELSLALGTLSSGVNYDVFAYATGGTVALDPPVAWSNDTTRATTLTRQNGILTKTGDSSRRYIGTFRTSSTTTTEDSAVKRYVFNVTNQTVRSLRRIEPTGNWTYASRTIRAANGSTANRVEVVIGDVGPLVNVLVQVWTRQTASDYCGVAIGEDSTTTASTNSVATNFGAVSSSPTNDSTLSSTVVVNPTVGYHYYQWLEAGSTLGTTTFRGTESWNGFTVYGGMVGTVSY